jgi:hypothetical protein
MLNDDETYALSSVDNGPKRVTFILMFHRWRGIASVKEIKHRVAIHKKTCFWWLASQQRGI